MREREQERSSSVMGEHLQRFHHSATPSLRILGWFLVCCGASSGTQESTRGHPCLLNDVLDLAMLLTSCR